MLLKGFVQTPLFINQPMGKGHLWLQLLHIPYIYIYSIYKPYTTYKYIYIYIYIYIYVCIYIYIQCVDIQCVQPRIKSSVPLDSPPESLLQAASETVAATATAAAHPWSAGVFSAPVRVGLGEEGYEMIYRSYIYIYILTQA